MPAQIPQKKGDPKIPDTDEHARFGITLESLQRLKPPFKKNGSVTAGHASSGQGINCRTEKQTDR